MKRSTSKALYAYGIFLILAGLVGYLSNPEKAATAIASGGTFGSLNIALGYLGSRGWQKASLAALGLTSLLGAVFIWRSTVTWMAYADGRDEKLRAAIIISSMLVATLCMVTFLLRARRDRSATTA